jgi:hypothetical protein
MSPYIFIGLVLVVVVVLLLCYSLSPARSSSRYERQLGLDERRMIDRLVVEAAPKLRGKAFMRGDVMSILGVSTIDPVIYFHFQRLMTEERDGGSATTRDALMRAVISG